ncbi:hypothetical protein ACE01N_12485 [Saccharicrinis sp. FJH2]|uniref:HYC_CC_PP family protein n=1 Tax=Saccharicrinis sp. FJH65 TaxID=3344659 RepID=UPI0035F25C2D
MRLILNITVSLILMVATTGVTISKHYCHNHLVDVSVNHHADKCCDTGCNSCKDEVASYKVTDTFMGADVLASLPVTVIQLYLNAVVDITEATTGVENQHFTELSTGPPPVTTISRLSKIQTFLI